MSNNPLISHRIALRCGSASDPVGKEGLACLTARLMTRGASASRSYKQILDAFFEMATDFDCQVDQELTVFSGVVHRDHAERYEAMIREMLHAPAFLEEDLERVRSELLNALRVSLRGSNDEALAKELLFATVFEGHPYGHPSLGTVAGLNAIRIEDVRAFHQRLRKNIPLEIPPPRTLSGIESIWVEKPDARGVAMSFGHPIEVIRGHADYHALLVAQCWLGQHRNGGQLFDSIREVRGLNYGDYTYIEYFPRGMFEFEPVPNVARRRQIFEVWLRPVEPAKALFALKLAIYEISMFLENGMSAADFDRTRNFLSKYVKLLLKTESIRQGYAIDSDFYGIGEYARYIEEGLRNLTLEDVTKAARKHINLNNFCLVAVGPEIQALADRLDSNEPTPINYEIEQPEDVLAVDKIVAALSVAVSSSKTIRFEEVFER